MQNAAEAYGRVQKQGGTSREREAALLTKAALQMQHVKDAGDTNSGQLYRALHYNRKLWTIFVTAVAQEDNPLPQEIKNNIASLGVFIFKHTMDTLSSQETDKLNTLITINREVAAGLREQAG